MSSIPAGPSTPRLPTLVYGALRAIARKHLAGERPDHTLQPTDLAHEACLRLFNRDGAPGPESANFLLAAAGTMRAILVDHARRRSALKRGGEHRRAVLTDEWLAAEPGGVDLPALDESLDRLRRLDEQLARVVELRFFGGLGDADIATVLRCSTRSVRRAWSVARAWPARDLGPRETA